MGAGGREPGRQLVEHEEGRRNSASGNRRPMAAKGTSAAFGCLSPPSSLPLTSILT